MKKLYKQNNPPKQKLVISLLLVSIIFLYWRLNQIGYLPPVHYVFSILGVDRNFPENSLLPLS